MLLQKIQTKDCEMCGEQFTKLSNMSKKYWARRKACSISCSRKLIGNDWLKQYNFRKGVQSSTKPFVKGQTAHNYKGDTASYSAKHIWIRYHYGKANHCENCGKIEDAMYHWSNKSGEYLRDITDWQQLCVRCHKNYDLAKRLGL